MADLEHVEQPVGAADAVTDRGRQRGGLFEVRPGVWRVDVELPKVDGRRRRVSKQVTGTRNEAAAALDEMRRAIAAGSEDAPVPRTKKRGGGRRPTNAGAITKLGPDRWLIGVEGERDPVTDQRRRHTQVVRGSREDAEVALARLTLVKDDDGLQAATSVHSVQSACGLYLREARTELQTQRTDRSACNRICSTVLPGGQLLGEVPLSKLTWKVIEEAYAKWDRSLVPSTKARYASTLSKVLEHAKRAGWIRSNPAKDAKRPKVPTHRPDVPVHGDVRAALATARELDFMTYAYVLGMATIGCRRSELLALTVADVDLTQHVVTIRASIADGGPGKGVCRKTTKRDDWRDVPLTGQMADVLAELLERRRTDLAAYGRSMPDPAGYVFSDDPDGATWIRPDGMTKRWLNARGDSTVTFAQLRRFVATQLLDVTNGDYRTVASITGNSEETLRRWYDAGPNLEKKRAVVGMAAL
jgi:integrase